MHSSSADCVLGVARLISSARTTWLKIGPGPELELLRLLVVDRQARHVRGQQVRGELDPPERAAEAPGDRLGEDRLAGPRDVLDQEVAAAQQRDQGEADLVVLADDDALDVGEDLVAGFLDLAHRPLSQARAPGLAPGSGRGRNSVTVGDGAAVR